jgi:nicotinate-nucleotide adenylyltransferase
LSACRTVLVFGGSFNPPHIGHVLAVCAARAQLEACTIQVIPTYQHPFGKALVPFEARVAMCKLALDWIPGLQVSTIERDLGGESRTVRTLRAIKAQDPSATLRLLVGSDILQDAHKWHAFDEVCALAPLLILDRAGAPRDGGGPNVLPAVSSTQLRELLQHPSAGDQTLGVLLPQSVRAFIAAHHLYSASTADPV